MSAEAKPLRRRAAMLLGQWAVKLPATERPAAYRSLITLMGEEDAAVQLAAVSSPSSYIHRVTHVMTVLASLERPLFTMRMPLCAKRPSLQLTDADMYLWSVAWRLRFLESRPYAFDMLICLGCISHVLATYSCIITAAVHACILLN